MERPNEKNRWDKPLFTIWAEDQIPYEDIHQHLFKSKKKTKNYETNKIKPKI